MEYFPLNCPNPSVNGGDHYNFASVESMMKILCFLLLVIFLHPVYSQKISRSGVHLLYTGNLNGALDDCGCGDSVVGGFTRILSLIDSFRVSTSPLLILDGGDFLSSYSQPRANRVMLHLISRAGYTALNLGDQEFVESPDFIFKTVQKWKRSLPFLSHNAGRWNASRHFSQNVMQMKMGKVTISIVGLIDPPSFEFISPEALRLEEPEVVLRRVAGEINKRNGLQIVLFHGTWDRARALAERFPWLDVMILAHNQHRGFDLWGNTALMESGVDGEYLGYLHAEWKGKRWRFENKFIPVVKSLPVPGFARKLVDDFYRKP